MFERTKQSTKDWRERRSVPFLHIAICTCLCVYICMCVLLLERVSCRARIDGRHSSPVNCPVISGIWAPGETKVLGIYWGGEKKKWKQKQTLCFLLTESSFHDGTQTGSVVPGCWQLSPLGALGHVPLLDWCWSVFLSASVRWYKHKQTLHMLFSWRHEEKG